MKEEEAAQMEATFRKGSFSFDDYLKQLKMVGRMGPLDKMLGMIPGLSAMSGSINTDDLGRELRRKEAMIQSMTHQERKNPKILNGSRRKRIAAGSGVGVNDLNRLIKEYGMFAKMMRKAAKGGLKNLFKGLTPQAFS